MRACAADHRGRDRRRLRRRRRDPRDGVGSAGRHREGQGRLPVQSRRSCRLRHGRLRDPAAHHRPGPRRGAALYRPRHGRRGSRALGLLQPAVVVGERAGGCDRARQRALRRPDLRQRHDQAHAGDGMGDVGRAVDRGGSGGAGAVHGDARISSAPSTPLRRSRSRCSRATRCRSPKPSAGRSSMQGHRDFAERLSRWAADNLHKLPHDDVDEACRARVKALGEAGFLAPTVPANLRRRAPAARCAHALPRARDSGLSRRARRFRLRDAGARHRLDHALRHAGIESSAICRNVAQGQEHRRLRAFPSSKPVRMSRR